MYKTILMPLDGTPTDRVIIEHIKQLAKILGSRVVLFHVVTSAAAQWHGPDAGGEAVEGSQAYLDRIKAEFEAAAIPAQAELAYGDPVREIVKWTREKDCDLVAMGTHGHRRCGRPVSGSHGEPDPTQRQLTRPSSQGKMRLRHDPGGLGSELSCSLVEARGTQLRANAAWQVGPAGSPAART